ncbi:MAG: PSD1 and planctomycete cytochrome C domain-containing protein [Acidobacteria bacterium]|nr:PSD1 and planctomycete cytochrome C domain-containing protein [Acidobacteriota bacterium]
MRSGFSFLVLVTVSATLAAAQTVDFARDVQPIFEKRCAACHGAKLQMHGYRLDRRGDAFRGGESGVPSIVPGHSQQSPLYIYVAGLDPEIKMPPGKQRIPAAEIETIKNWIDQGAVWAGGPGEPTASPDNAVLKRGHGHWAFQPPLKPAVPAVKNTAWVRNPIDAFVLAKLEAKGWNPARPATSPALLRRLFLNLTGLPPTLAEQKQWLADPRPESFDRLVDNLLARPTYGERWARHWLDLVRYAESNGYERDAAKPQVWRFRDYVIRAFNDDKPLNRFLVEQLAGDELPEVTPETLVATGYYRLGPWDDEPADPAEDRFDQLDDIVSTTSQAFLGLTLGCARCHNHKFEPLLASDYYSMVAVFNGLQRPRNGRTELDLPLGSWAQIDKLAARDQKIEPWTKEIFELRGGKANAKKPVAEIDATLPPAVLKRIAELNAEIDALRRETPDLERGYRMQELSKTAPATPLLIRGKAARPGPEVPPAVPTILASTQPTFPAAGERSSDRRLAFANWLISRENPVTARVLVNRIWQAHFGEGLVRTPSDFGIMGDKPTHPELLDWLTTWFIDNGWSVKKLHRLILASNTYRMGREANAAYMAADPENRLLWHLPYKRLEVEAILDSTLAVSGQLNPTMYGPSMYPHVPEGALAGSSDPDKIWKPFNEQDASRRTIYAFVKRSLIVPLMEVMDFCDTARSSAKRMTTSVAPQALSMFNGDFINRQAAHLAARLRREAGSDPAAQVELAYRLALARAPTATERDNLQTFLKDNTLEQMCRVLFNLNEFVYPD